MKKLFILLFLLPILSTSGWTAIVQEQVASGGSTGGTDASSVTLTFSAALTVGHTVFVVCEQGTGSAPCQVDSADPNISWFGMTKGNNVLNLSIFYGRVRAAGVTTVVVSTNTGTGPIVAVGAAYSGITNPTLDTSSYGSSGTGTAVSSGATPITTSYSGQELWIGGMVTKCNYTTPTTWTTPGGGYTEVGRTTTTKTGGGLDRAIMMVAQIGATASTPVVSSSTNLTNSWMAYQCCFFNNDVTASGPGGGGGGFFVQ